MNEHVGSGASAVRRELARRDSPRVRLALAASLLVLLAGVLVIEHVSTGPQPAPVAIGAQADLPFPVGDSLARADQPLSGGWPSGVDIALKLLAVVALIYGVAAVVRRYVLRVPTGSHGLVRVLEATTLGPRKAIYVVEVGGKVLVVGGTDSNLSTLAEITDPDAVAQLLGPSDGADPAFLRHLNRSLGRALSQEPSGVVSPGPRPSLGGLGRSPQYDQSHSTEPLSRGVTRLQLGGPPEAHHQ